ncbi:MAG: hypothetical protein FJ333_09940 [Sphingomonadales bacterium]|nr:hypothetical protein [Sphingomonadales bacterium]
MEAKLQEGGLSATEKIQLPQQFDQHSIMSDDSDAEGEEATPKQRGIRHATRNSSRSNDVNITDAEETQMNQYIQKYLLDYCCLEDKEMFVFFRNGYVVVCAPKVFIFSPLRSFSFVAVSCILRQIPLAISQLLTCPFTSTSMLEKMCKWLGIEACRDAHSNFLFEFASLVLGLNTRFNKLFKLFRWPGGIVGTRLRVDTNQNFLRDARLQNQKPSYIILVKSVRGWEGREVIDNFFLEVTELYQMLTQLDTCIQYMELGRVVERIVLDNTRYPAQMKTIPLRPSISSFDTKGIFRNYISQNVNIFMFPNGQVHEMRDANQKIEFIYRTTVTGIGMQTLLQALNEHEVKCEP